MIKKISESKLEAIKRKSAYALPNRPSEVGMKPDDIKKAFYQPIIDAANSIASEINRIVDESNNEFMKQNESMKTFFLMSGFSYIQYPGESEPAELYGGIWEEVLSGKFPLGSSTEYPIGSTGGESNHTLTVDEIAAHSHSITIPDTVTSYSDRYTQSGGTFKIPNGLINTTFTSSSAGGGKSHNNMPPYVAVTFWKFVSFNDSEVNNENI